MNLKAGSRYFRVDGRVTGELIKISDPEVCFVDPITGYAYSEEGFFHCESRPSMVDLTRECFEEQKTDAAKQGRQVVVDYWNSLIANPARPLVKALREKGEIDEP